MSPVIQNKCAAHFTWIYVRIHFNPSTSVKAKTQKTSGGLEGGVGVL